MFVGGQRRAEPDLFTVRIKRREGTTEEEEEEEEVVVVGEERLEHVDGDLTRKLDQRVNAGPSICVDGRAGVTLGEGT